MASLNKVTCWPIACGCYCRRDVCWGLGGIGDQSWGRGDIQDWAGTGCSLVLGVGAGWAEEEEGSSPFPTAGQGGRRSLAPRSPRLGQGQDWPPSPSRDQLPRLSPRGTNVKGTCPSPGAQRARPCLAEPIPAGNAMVVSPNTAPPSSPIPTAPALGRWQDATRWWEQMPRHGGCLSFLNTLFL